MIPCAPGRVDGAEKRAYTTINNIPPPVKNPVLFCRQMHILTCGRKNFLRWRCETGPMPGQGVFVRRFCLPCGAGREAQA